MNLKSLLGTASIVLVSMVSCHVNDVAESDLVPTQFSNGVERLSASVAPYDLDNDDNYSTGVISSLDLTNDSSVDTSETIEGTEGNSSLETKSTLSYSGAFSWETSDQLIFWPSQSSTYTGNVVGIPFRISDISVVDGKSYAMFEGDGWALKRGATYYASTPYNSENTSTKVEVDYSGQNPLSNGDESHLGKYDFLHASFLTPSEGDASITFNHLGSIRKFILHLPEGAGIEEGNAVFILSCQDKIFCEKAYYNPSVESVNVSFTKASEDMVSEIGYLYGDAESPVLREDAGDITITLMMMPTSWAGKEITVTLKDLDPSSENNYSGTFTPSNDILSARRGKVEVNMTRPELTSTRCLTFTTTPLSGSNEVSVHNVNNAPNLDYSYDGTNWNSWSEINYGALEFSNTIPLYIRGNNPDGLSTTNDNFSSFVFSTDASVSCVGNVMSLLSYEEDLNEIPTSYCFKSLFNNCTALVNAPELPASSLTEWCYARMFSGCSSLVEAPALPAKVLANSCYYYMFSDCESLTVVSELPATTLAIQCYSWMFKGCTSLENAPLLPALKLERVCYDNMFNGCSSLNYIKMLATDVSANNCLRNWTNGVASTGTFIKNTYASWDVVGVNGVPSGWTVNQEAPYSYVDLGLPSGVKWANVNIGSTSPEGYGDYFAWGETKPKTNYSWSTYQYCDASESALTKYCNDSDLGLEGYSDNKVLLEVADDAAHVIWGGNWRMPTNEEYSELIQNCSWEWVSVNGVNCYKVTSNINSNYIYLPASGYYDETTLTGVGSIAEIWSSSSYFENSSDAIYQYFNNTSVDSSYHGSRYVGRTIRPVYSEDASSGVTGITLDKSSLTLFVEDTYTLDATVSMNPGSVNDQVEWTSSNPDVAKVDYTGKVTALSMGTATITAKTVFGEFTATCDIIVNPSDLSITLNKSELNLKIGETEYLIATILPENVPSQEIIWTIEDNALWDGENYFATVGQDGLVSALNEGTETIIVTVKSTGRSASCVVNVAPNDE